MEKNPVFMLFLFVALYVSFSLFLADSWKSVKKQQIGLYFGISKKRAIYWEILVKAVLKKFFENA